MRHDALGGTIVASMGGLAECDDSKRPSAEHDEGRPSSDDVNAHAPQEKKPDDLGRLAPSHVLDAIGKARDEFAARHGTAAGAIAGVAAAEIVSAIKAAWGELSGESESEAMATAAASFRLHRDYPSLARLLPWLTPGTNAVRLLALLGPVDFDFPIVRPLFERILYLRPTSKGIERVVQWLLADGAVFTACLEGGALQTCMYASPESKSGLLDPPHMRAVLQGDNGLERPRRWGRWP